MPKPSHKQIKEMISNTCASGSEGTSLAHRNKLPTISIVGFDVSPTSSPPPCLKPAKLQIILFKDSQENFPMGESNLIGITVSFAIGREQSRGSFRSVYIFYHSAVSEIQVDMGFNQK